MKKQAIATDKAPAAIGPYSQGIRAGDLVFTSGQLPQDMQSGRLETEDIRKATVNCLTNVGAILEAGGSSLRNALKITVFITNMADFAAMNEAYTAFFGDVPPARSCVQVAALPKGVTIEIEAVGLVDAN